MHRNPQRTNNERSTPDRPANPLQSSAPPAKRSRGSKNSGDESNGGDGGGKGGSSTRAGRKTPPPEKESKQPAEVARLATKLQVARGNSLLRDAGEGGKRGGRSSRRR